MVNKEVSVNRRKWIAGRDYLKFFVKAALNLWVPYAMELVHTVRAIKTRRLR